jgi:putative membrane protein
VGAESAAGSVVDSARGATLPDVAAAMGSGDAFAIVDTSYTQMIAEDTLAAARATNARVKSFARRVASQEAVARRGLRQVAAQQNITPMLGPHNTVKDNAQSLKDLRGKTGADFDKAYVDHAIEMRDDLLNTVHKALASRDREVPVRDFLAEVQRNLTADRDSLKAIKDTM